MERDRLGRLEDKRRQQAWQQRGAAVEVHALQRQQALLRDGAAERGEATDLVACGQHAVAGDDERQGIATHSLADGAGGARLTHLPRECAVGRGLTPSHLARDGIDAAMKLRQSVEVQHDAGKVHALTGGVASERVDRLRDGLRSRGTRLGTRARAQATLGGATIRFGELHARQPAFGPGDPAGAELRVEHPVLLA